MKKKNNLPFRKSQKIFLRVCVKNLGKLQVKRKIIKKL